VGYRYNTATNERKLNHGSILAVEANGDSEQITQLRAHPTTQNSDWQLVHW
jgi:hypothetical protein